MYSYGLVLTPRGQGTTLEPQTYSIPEAADVLGISVGHAEWLVARDEFPVPLLVLEGRTLASRGQLKAWVGLRRSARDSGALL